MPVLPPYIPVGIETCRVDFDALDFRRELVQHGKRIWWEPVTDCPCRQIRTLGGRAQETKEPRITCEGCGGSGDLYDTGQQIVGKFHGLGEQQKRYNEYGPMAAGYGWLSLLPEHLPAIDDRFTLLDGWHVVREAFKHEETIEQPRYPIIRRTFYIGNGQGFKTPKEVTYGVTFCRVTDTGGVLLPNNRVEGVDFVITSDGKIDWTLGEGLGTAPEVGAYYTLRYFARPVYIVQDHVYVTRDLWNRTGGTLGDGTASPLKYAQMPVEVFCMAEHLGLKRPPIVAIDPQATYMMPG